MATPPTRPHHPDHVPTPHPTGPPLKLVRFADPDSTSQQQPPTLISQLTREGDRRRALKHCAQAGLLPRTLLPPPRPLPTRRPSPPPLTDGPTLIEQIAERERKAAEQNPPNPRPSSPDLWPGRPPPAKEGREDYRPKELAPVRGKRVGKEPTRRLKMVDGGGFGSQNSGPPTRREAERLSSWSGTALPSRTGNRPWEPKKQLKPTVGSPNLPKKSPVGTENPFDDAFQVGETAQPTHARPHNVASITRPQLRRSVMSDSLLPVETPSPPRAFQQTPGLLVPPSPSTPSTARPSPLLSTRTSSSSSVTTFRSARPQPARYRAVNTPSLASLNNSSIGVHTFLQHPAPRLQTASENSPSSLLSASSVAVQQEIVQRKAREPPADHIETNSTTTETSSFRRPRGLRRLSSMFYLLGSGNTSTLSLNPSDKAPSAIYPVGCLAEAFPRNAPYDNHEWTDVPMPTLSIRSDTWTPIPEVLSSYQQSLHRAAVEVFNNELFSECMVSAMGSRVSVAGSGGAEEEVGLLEEMKAEGADDGKDEREQNGRGRRNEKKERKRKEGAWRKILTRRK